MIRQTLSVLLSWAAEKLCAEHVALVGTDPLVCARCWKRLG